MCKEIKNLEMLDIQTVGKQSFRTVGGGEKVENVIGSSADSERLYLYNL